MRQIFLFGPFLRSLDISFCYGARSTCTCQLDQRRRFPRADGQLLDELVAGFEEFEGENQWVGGGGLGERKVVEPVLGIGSVERRRDVGG